MKIPPLRKNPDGRAFVEIPKSGRKRVYFGVYGTQEATDSYRVWVKQYADGDAPKFKEGSKTTLAKAYLEYLKYLKDRTSPQVYQQARLAFLKLVVYGGRRMLATDITPAFLRSFQKHLSKQTYNRGGTEVRFSRRYVNDILKRVKRFARWGMGEGLLPVEIAHRIETLEPLAKGRSEAREVREVQPVSWEDVQKTLPFLNPTIQRMVQVQFLCGMRPGEVCAMKRKEVDREGVVVEEGDEKVRIWLYHPETHKGTWREQSLEKAIPPIAQALLIEWEGRGDCGDYFFSPRQATKDAYNWQGPWMPGENVEWDRVLGSLNDKYTTNIYDQAVAYGVKRARGVHPELPPWTPNQLRHGMATMIRRFIDTEAASVYAGHKRIDTTLIYAKKTREKLVLVASQFDRLIDREGGSG